MGSGLASQVPKAGRAATVPRRLKAAGVGFGGTLATPRSGFGFGLRAPPARSGGAVGDLGSGSGGPGG